MSDLVPGTATHRAIVITAWATAGVVAVSSAAFGWGALGGAGSVFDPSSRGERTTEVLDAVTSVAVTTESVDVHVRYDDVAHPRIVERDLVEGGLSYRTEGGKLVVEHTGQQAWRWIAWKQLTIVLPRSMEADTPDVSLRATTASLEVDGSFGTVDAQAQTGSIEVDGRFQSFTGRTINGSIDMRGGATDVSAETSTGSVDIALYGTPPRSVDARTATGSVDITVPDGTYAVDARPGMGSSDIEVAQDPSSPHRITAQTGTGSIDVTN